MFTLRDMARHRNRNIETLEEAAYWENSDLHGLKHVAIRDGVKLSGLALQYICVQGDILTTNNDIRRGRVHDYDHESRLIAQQYSHDTHERLKHVYDRYLEQFRESVLMKIRSAKLYQIYELGIIFSKHQEPLSSYRKDD